MKIALAQINTIVGDLDGNSSKIAEFHEKSISAGADLVVFPELCLTGYPPKDLLDYSHFVDSNVVKMRQLASKIVKGAAIVGFVDRNPKEGKPLFNAAACLAEGKVQAVFRKTLLPTYDVFDEERYFEPSPDPVSIWEWSGKRIGVTICEDLWSEVPVWGTRRRYRRDPVAELAKLKADLIINLSSSPFQMGKIEFRLGLARRQAQAHGIPVAMVNQVGGNDEILFDGSSCVFDAQGNLIALGKSFEEDTVSCDPFVPRGFPLPFPAYDPAGTLAQALVLGTRDYVHKCGFSKVCLGLSGGIDSAVVAAIAAEAVGPRNVTGVVMPSRFNAPISGEDAEALARNLGIETLAIPIEPAFQAYLKTLEPAFAGRPFDAAEENIQARIRGNLLMALSNKFGPLVLSTGNKSELSVGYCTLYGDMSGGLAVISDVPKAWVYKLGEYFNRDREVIPRRIFDRPPTAELRENQKDSDSLPEYPVLDAILAAYIEERLGPDEIAARGHPKALVEKIVRQVDASEYKRRQAAPGLKVTSKAFGFGRRMPIAARFNR